MQAEYKNILEQLAPYHARLVAVSKTQPPGAILELYALGQRKFGENKVQELIPKQEQLPKDIEWHVIGHLQRNKVKYIAPFVAMIESVDSLELLQEINRQGMKCDRVIPCLLQFHIAQEISKFGLSPEDAERMLGSEVFHSLRHVRIAGVMGMASFTEDLSQVRAEFRSLKGIFERLKATFFAGEPGFCEISMGMSSDYPIALEEGATLVRLGTLLFGERRQNEQTAS